MVQDFRVKFYLKLIEAGEDVCRFTFSYITSLLWLLGYHSLIRVLHSIQNAIFGAKIYELEPTDKLLS
jgi:hypothetical protein